MEYFRFASWSEIPVLGHLRAGRKKLRTIMRSAKWCVLGAVICLSMPAAKAQLNAAKARAISGELLPATVLIRVEVVVDGKPDTRKGTGFIIHPSGYVLTTAGHVYPKEGATTEKGTITSRGRIFGSVGTTSTDGQEELEFVMRSPQFDAVLLKFKRATFGPKQVVKLSDFPWDLYDEVVVVGYPGGAIEDSVKSEISSRGLGSTPVLRQQLNPGNSGSPVANHYGEVFSMVLSDWGAGSNLTFVLPLNSVRDLRARAGVSTRTGTGVRDEGQGKPDTYAISATIAGSHSSTNEVSAMFAYRKIERNCDANYEVRERFCVGDGYRLAGSTEVTSRGLSCGSSIESSTVVTDKCVEVPFRIRGCGYDDTVAGQKQCREIGRVNYDVKLQGRKSSATAIPLQTFVFEKTVGPGVPISIAHSLASSLPEAQWTFDATVDVYRAGVKVATMSGNPTNLFSRGGDSGFGLVSQMNAGTLTLTINEYASRAKPPAPTQPR